jgi:hypothetical protein
LDESVEVYEPRGAVQTENFLEEQMTLVLRLK